MKLSETENPFLRGRFISPVIGGLLFISVWLVFSPLLRSDFINFDDPHYVTENPQVLGGVTFETVKWAFTESHSSNWHPLTWISHMLDCELFGMQPGGHHASNIFLHGLSSILLFACLRRMTGSYWRSALVAWLFALHPLHVESVAWISERKDVLSTFFGFVSLWFYIRHVTRRTTGQIAIWNRDYIMALLALAFGLMSKPMLVTFPFFLLLLDVWPLQRIPFDGIARPSNLKRCKDLLVEKLPFFVLSAVSCVITFLAQRDGGAVQSLEKYSLPDRLANAAVSYVRYLQKSIWPDDLAIFYPYHEWSLPVIFGAVILLSAITVAVWVFRARLPFLTFGWFWYLGTLIPVIGIVQVGEQAMADRYTYLPLVGIFIALVWWIPVSFSPTLKRVVLLGGASAIALLAVLTHRQVKHWRNTETLFQHALSVTRDNYIAHNTLGLEFLARNDLEQARLHFTQAVEIRENYADPLCNLATLLAQEGQTTEAKLLFLRAIEANPAFEQAYFNLGNLYRSENDRVSAWAAFLKVIEINPKNADAHSNLGLIAVQEGDMKTASDYFAQAVRIQPGEPVAVFNLGLALSSLGEYAQAEQVLKRALELRPDFPEAENELRRIAQFLSR